MTFEWPLALAGLAVVPLLVVAYLVFDRRRRAYAARFGNPALLPAIVDRAPGRLRYVPLAVLLLALAAMVVGVARPHATVSVRKEEATVILAIDVSRSMKARDVQPTRLLAARSAARRFLSRVPPKYRVAVISFGTRAVVAVPPTDNRTLVEAALKSLKPGEGTALGDAVALAAKLSSRQRASDGSVPPASMLLISDGKQDGGRITPQVGASKARKAHLPVYTILLGTPNGVVTERYVGGYTQTIKVPPQPDTLRELARATGGQFFTATSDKRLQDVYEHLGSRLGHKRESREVTDLFAGGSGLLLLVGAGLSALWFRRLVP